MKEKKLKDQLAWFVNLRWFAAGGVFAVLLLSRSAFGLRLPYNALYAGAFALLFYNIICFLYNRRLIRRFADQRWMEMANRFANTQIAVDLAILVYFIHFAGGIENPFIFYFIFHMVIASILLSNKAAYLQATLAVVLMGLLVAGEHLQIIPHHHLEGFIGQENIGSRKYVAAAFAVFSSTLYITVYMATNIVNKLRDSENELAIANLKLAEQDRLKSQYVLRVSHDIQSPLATIQNCLDVVLGGYSGQMSSKAREMIGRAGQKTNHLLHFVRNLLNLSRIKIAENPEKSPVVLNEIITGVVAQLKPAAEEKNISLEADLPEERFVLNTDPDSLEELLANLLRNAVKYTPWKGSAGIRLKKPAGKAGCFHFEVWDTGIGIAKEELPKIFDDFYRSKNAENFVKEGTGLGLPIVKEILRTLGGDMWVDSCEGRGSSFFLPCQTGMTAAAAV